MSLAVFTFDFDPYLRLGDRAVSLETLGVAAAVFVAVVLAGLIAGRTSVLLAGPGARTSPWGRPTPASAIRPDWPQLGHLRRDDLLLVAVGAVPGAIAGGRLGQVLVHLDFYAANPGAILDPSQGALQLGLALVGGACSGAFVARLLDRRLGVWLHVAAVPVLVGLGLGKLALALGGSGQGAAWSGDPGWAGGLTTAYAGAGPWGSLAPATAAYPAQLLEASFAFEAAFVVALLLVTGRFRARDGRAFLVALGLWAVGRFVVAFTWRDGPVLGPIRADQLVSLAIAAGCLVGWWLATRATRRGRAAADAEADARASLRWPEPRVGRQR